MKHFFTLLVCCLLGGAAIAQPANDNCSGAINLPLLSPQTVCPNTPYTNVNATGSTILPSNIPACFNQSSPNRDVWFKFTVPVGSDGNVSITLASTAVNGIRNPEIALYVGNCGAGIFNELNCASSAGSPTPISTLTFNQLGLLAGDYFLRVNDWSSTLTPNSGEFTVCVKELPPIFNMGGSISEVGLCSGTLYDHAGSSNYAIGRNDWFRICPTAPHQCITVTIDSMALENNFDFLGIWDVNPTLTDSIRLDRLTGTISGAVNSRITMEARSGGCVSFRFNSDNSGVAAGFKARWSCSPNACASFEPTTCATPEPIVTLPFSGPSSTCNDINTLDTLYRSPTGTTTVINGARDHFFRYVHTGPSAICVRAAISGEQTGTHLAVTQNCPTISTRRYMGYASGTNPNIPYLAFEDPGEYYFIVSRPGACTNFNLTLDTINCRDTLPANSTCSSALSINNCSNQAPEIIQVNPQASDPTFITDINRGCIIGPQQRYAFFMFRAEANGRFGFTARAALPPTTFGTDIDFSVWGPINSVADICNFTRNNQPVRSSWTGNIANGLTGMVDVHPTSGIAITDTFDCVATPGGANDAFVRTLQVQQGKYYIVFLDDFSRAITQGGIRLDFTNTSNGVLGAGGDPFSVSRDTAVCPGSTVTLRATGGVRYTWSPTTGIVAGMQANRDSLVVQPTETTTYQVRIASACDITTRPSTVTVFSVAPQRDRTICIGEDLQFDMGRNFPSILGATWSWTITNRGADEMTCLNCATPRYVARTPGIKQFIVALTTPNCVLRDTFDVEVLTQNAPDYTVATFNSGSRRDTNLCIGTSFGLMSVFDPAATFIWRRDSINGTIVSGSNPMVTNAGGSNIRYYLTATNGSCPVPSYDSVVIRTYNKPLLRGAADTSVCRGISVSLGRTAPEINTTYLWSPGRWLNDSTLASPIATPLDTTSYILTATNLACTIKDTVKINAVQLAITMPDTLRHCRGNNLLLTPTQLIPTNQTIIWRSTDNFLRDSSVANGGRVTVSPTRAVRYFSRVATPGCERRDTTLVLVDSLPFATNIMPTDTSVCQGTLLILKSPTFDPVFFPRNRFRWIVGANRAESPDSLYNLVVTMGGIGGRNNLIRFDTSGVCVRQDTAKIDVILIPILTITPTNPRLCEGENVTFVGSGNAVDFKWNILPLVQDRQAMSVALTAPPVGTYTVALEAKDSSRKCPANTSTVLRVFSKPSVSFPSRTTVCVGDLVDLNARRDTGVTYSWTGLGITAANRTIQNPQILGTAANAGRYVVNMTNSFGCSRSDSFNLAVATATVNAGRDTSVCVGTNANLNATLVTNTGIGTFNWQPRNLTGANHIVRITDTTNFFLTYNFHDRCVSRDTIKVNAIPNFTLRLNPDTLQDKIYDWGTTINLATTTTGPVTSPTYTWTANEVGIGTTATIAHKALEADGLDRLTYRVTVNSTTGCSNTVQTTIWVRRPHYLVPNAFTPNGDNLNATFRPLMFAGNEYTRLYNAQSWTIPTDGSCRTLEPATTTRPCFWKGLIQIEAFEVYNRWGQQVYAESNPTATSYKGWDGKISGNDAPSDVYAFIIRLRMPDGTLKVESGELNLVR